MKVLLKKFYSSGYHVVNITSPSHPNFIVSASAGSIPGNLWIDAQDLHWVMTQIKARLEKNNEISGYYVTGYSLGGTHAAFVDYYDQQVKTFNFKKVLLINPPVSLYNSVGILDDMLDKSTYGGEGGNRRLAEEIFQNLAHVFEREDYTEFDEDFLYTAYKGQKPTDAELAALIGLSFRLSSSNMIFSADVMARKGYIYPKKMSLGVTDSTSSYLRQLGRVNFKQYIADIFYPHFKEISPAITLEQLIHGSSLHSLDRYIRGNPKFMLVTNRDDIILAPGEIGYLNQLFAGRAWIFPNGGHCGNLEHPDFLQAASNALALNLGK